MMALGQELQQAAAAVLTAHQRTALTAPRCQLGTHLEVEATHRRCLEAMHQLLRQTLTQPPRTHLLLRRTLQLALR